ncbi:hypothetical protein BGX34_001428 [Mortierella sp. NVP85]|nr:hypothetical protein BGX34_001428 [Mortierella sp. NVP85]
MVSKSAGLTLLAVLASTVNAYSWYGHIHFTTNNYSDLKYQIHPVDVQVPGNDRALVLNGDLMTVPELPPWNKTGYGNIGFSFGFYQSKPELIRIYDNSAQFYNFPCTKIEEFVVPETSTTNSTTWKVYSCKNPEFDGRKGIPVSGPTTTTPPVATATATATSCPAVTVTVPVTVATTNPPQTTTSPPKPSPTCLAGYEGKKNGKGLDGACCSSSDDCRDTCVQGICKDRCLTGYEGKKNGKGPNGACCSHSDDCKDTCVYGICGVHP